MANQFLFIYGTLLQTQNEFGLYLQNNSNLYSTGRFRGKLYDVGEYPGAALTSEADVYVHGSIVSLNDISVLQQIDFYEGYGSKQPKPNLFIRKQITAETDNVNIKCWVYLYNHPVDNLHRIASGDYLQYIKQ